MIIVGIIAATLLAVAILLAVVLFGILAHHQLADGYGLRHGMRYSDGADWAGAIGLTVLALLITVFALLPYLFLGGFTDVVEWFA